MKADYTTEESRTNRVGTNESETDWKRIDAARDEDIDFSDCRELNEEFFENALLSAPDGTYRDEQGRVLTREEGINLQKMRFQNYSSKLEPECANLVVSLAPDVAMAFPNETAVNEALRLLVKIAKTQVRHPY